MSLSVSKLRLCEKVGGINIFETDCTTESGVNEASRKKEKNPCLKSKKAIIDWLKTLYQGKSKGVRGIGEMSGNLKILFF